MVYEEHQSQETEEVKENVVKEVKELITKESMGQSNYSAVVPINDQQLDTLDSVSEDKFIDITNLNVWNDLKFVEYYLKNKTLLLYILSKYGITEDDIRIKIEIRDDKYQDLIDCINHYKDNVEDKETK